MNRRDTSRSSAPGELEAGRGSLVNEVRGLFQVIEKAAKSLNLYEGRGEVCEAAVEQAYLKLSQIVVGGEVLLRISPYDFLLDDEPVYSSQEERTGLSYGLFRDGVRELRFLPSVEKWELEALLEILRGAPQGDQNEDSVTLLWNHGFKGIRYWAIEVAQESMFDVDQGGLQEQINELIQSINHQVEATDSIKNTRVLQEMLDVTIMDRALSWWRDRVTDLRQQSGQAPEVLYKAQLDNSTADTLRRSISIASLLLQNQEEDSDIASLIVQILEQLWDNGKWSELASVCHTLAESRQQKVGADAQANQALERALERLCTESRLLALQGLFAKEDEEQLSHVKEVLAILPAVADPHLVQLLLRAPPGDHQAQLLQVITARGADLSDYYAHQLRGKVLSECLSAVEALRASTRPSAIQTLRANLRHPNPRVQLAILVALETGLDDSAIPELVRCLTSANVEVQEQCIKVLELLQASRNKSSLFQWTKSSAFGQWPAPRRQRLLRLLIRWGGADIDEYVLGRVTVGNPLRRRKVEDQRQEMLQAIKGVGGACAQKLLRRCLKHRRFPKALIPSTEAVLQQLDKEQ